MKKNVILAIASTYSYYELQPFVESWKKNASNVELYLFYLNFSEWTKNCLRSMGVKLVDPPEEYKNITELQPGTIPYIRMKLFNGFLEKHIDEYKWVFIADTRDLIFQNDPFAYVNQEKFLRVSTEGIAIRDSGGNPDWITHLLGNEEWKTQFGHSEVVNGGIYYGSINEIVKYNKMILEMAPDKTFYGKDQATMNFLAYNGVLKDIISYSNPNTGDMASIFNNRDTYKIENDYIINLCGEAPNVLHQYDRVERLVKFVNNIYRKNVPNVLAVYSDVRSNLEMIRAYVYWGKYREALNLSFVVETYIRKDESPSLILPVIKDILSQCGLLNEMKMIPFIWQLIWECALSVFSTLSIENKIKYLGMYLDCVKNSKFIHRKDLERFRDLVWRLVQHHVEEEKWMDAYKLVEANGWLLKDIGYEFYLCSSEVYRHMNYADQSIALYSVAADIQCHPIYCLETYFNSNVVLRDKQLYHIRKGKPESFINEDWMTAFPLYVIKKQRKCVLFTFLQGKISYIQTIQANGEVYIGNKREEFDFSDIRDNLISIKINREEYLSARPNEKVMGVKWASGWEWFKIVRCKEIELYLSARQNRAFE